MSLRRLVSLIRGLGYTVQPNQHAPVSLLSEAGASAVPDLVRTDEGATVTSIRSLVRAMKNPQGVFGG